MSEPTVDLVADPQGAVTIAYVHENDVTYAWHHSLIELIAYDLGGEQRLMRGGWEAMRCGTDGLVQSRNKAAKLFLSERDAEWLFWVDTDAGFEPDIVDRLVEAADPVERPIVGALAFSYREDGTDGMGGWRCRPTPTIFDWVKTPDGQMGFTVRWGYAPDTLVRCAGTGSHAILIHRSVLERIEAEYGPVWYDRIPNTSTGQLVSEDLSFCLRAGALQIPIHVHTGVRTTHQKTSWIGEPDYLRANDAPPATEATAVLVPAIRAGNAERFMRTLRASTGLATAYAIAGPGEEEQAAEWKAAGAQVIHADITGQEEPLTFAQRMNVGYKATHEPWLFITGDDVRFRTGWLDQAQAVAHAGFAVVGTNDLGNPRVMAGDHATHMLISRAYVDGQGASWSGPGVLAHQGYRHWFVDDEIVTAAKQRGTWAMAIDSHVEHLHPAWGKGQDDDLYQLGQSHAEHDRGIFEGRKELYGRAS